MRSAAVIALLLAAACITSPPTGQAPATAGCRPTPNTAIGGPDYVPAGAPWQIRLGPGKQLAATAGNIAAGSRGQSLVLEARVLDTACRALAGAAVDVWEANSDGVYGPPDDDGGIRCCYLTGVARTNSEGRFELQTIMPGRYMGAPAHIHIAIAGPKGGSLATELEFGDPSHATATNAVSPTTASDGSLRASFDFVLADAR
jgi:protocatechuate 3,4-dioxygenase beta subunit